MVVHAKQPDGSSCVTKDGCIKTRVQRCCNRRNGRLGVFAVFQGKQSCACFPIGHPSRPAEAIKCLSCPSSILQPAQAKSPMSRRHENLMGTWIRVHFRLGSVSSVHVLSAACVSKAKKYNLANFCRTRAVLTPLQVPCWSCVSTHF